MEEHVRKALTDILRQPITLAHAQADRTPVQTVHMPSPTRLSWTRGERVKIIHWPFGEGDPFANADFVD